MDTAAIRDALVKFARRHKTELDRLGSRKSQLLEIGSLAVCAEHYRLFDYEVLPKNLKRGSFRVKLGSRGYPWNFSWFECVRDSEIVELHANLSVFSSYRMDDGVYVVDVGVSKGGAVPLCKPTEGWRAVENEKLITFAEAKSLVIYPMLLAQFVGIVSEITPIFLTNNRPSGFQEGDHFDPALISIGYLHATAHKIARAYPERGYLVKIVPAMDMKLSLLRSEGRLSASVLARKDEMDLDLPF
ncbi:MAG: hypothetical protein OXJ54_17010 [Gemmatimonadetes bacterium]|nr:hypothetical protein [Candidatus Palauibacter rhopaloidicola]